MTLLRSISPAASTTRYVDMVGVVAKLNRFQPLGNVCNCSTGILEMAVKVAGTSAGTWKRARNAGSSQDGKKLRASVASRLLPIMIFSSVPTLYQS